MASIALVVRSMEPDTARSQFSRELDFGSTRSTAAAVSSWLRGKTAEDVFFEPLKAGSVLATKRRLQLLRARVGGVSSVLGRVGTSLSSRLGQRRDPPTVGSQGALDTTELALLSHRRANIIKVPNVKASVPHSMECVEYF